MPCNISHLLGLPDPDHPAGANKQLKKQQTNKNIQTKKKQANTYTNKNNALQQSPPQSSRS